jgi:hypothetical protein
MALQRALTDTRTIAKYMIAMSRRGRRRCVNNKSFGRESEWKQRLVQILVVVAIIQMRTLKAEVEKVSMRTAIGHG